MGERCFHSVPGYPILAMPLGASNDVCCRTISLHSAPRQKSVNVGLCYVCWCIVGLYWIILDLSINLLSKSKTRYILAPGETWKIPANAPASGAHHWAGALGDTRGEEVEPSTRSWAAVNVRSLLVDVEWSWPVHRIIPWIRFKPLGLEPHVWYLKVFAFRFLAKMGNRWEGSSFI